MNITKNFTVEEMTNSTIAKRNNIINTPNDEQLGNLRKLCEQVLQPIRDKFGEPIIVDSAFRCDKLNKLVGGVANSDHRFGAACDIHTLSDKLTDNMRLWKLITKMAENGEISCRQIIFEYGDRKVGPNWIHLSINNLHNGIKKNQIVYVK